MAEDNGKKLVTLEDLKVGLDTVQASDDMLSINPSVIWQSNDVCDVADGYGYTIGNIPLYIFEITLNVKQEIKADYNAFIAKCNLPYWPTYKCNLNITCKDTSGKIYECIANINKSNSISQWVNLAILCNEAIPKGSTIVVSGFVLVLPS